MRKVCLIFLSIVLTACLSLVALSSASSAEEKEVAYLSLADYTGPLAGLNVPEDMAVEDYLKELNAKGGVDGVKIRFIGVDTRYNVAMAVSAYKQYRKTPRLLVVNAIGTGLGKAVAPLVEADKRLQLTPADGEFQAHIGRTFIWGPTYQDGFASIMDWVMEDWKAKGKSGAPVVGYIAWDNPMGREPLRGGKEYAEKIGVKLLPPEFYKPGTLKHDVYLNRLAQGGANYIHSCVVDPSETHIVRDAYQLGLTKKIQFISGYWGPSLLTLADYAKELEGTVIFSFYQKGEEAINNPVTAGLYKRNRGSLDKFVEIYGLGIVWMTDYVAALKIALKDVGYEKLQPDDMYKAYQKLTGLKRAGIQGPCAYSPTSRRGSNVIQAFRVQNGKIISIGGWRTMPDAISLYKSW